MEAELRLSKKTNRVFGTQPPKKNPAVQTLRPLVPPHHPRIFSTLPLQFSVQVVGQNDSGNGRHWTAGPLQRVPSGLITVRTDLPRPRWVNESQPQQQWRWEAQYTQGPQTRGRQTSTYSGATGGEGQTDHTPTGAIKGAEVGFPNMGHVHFTSNMEYFELCEHDSEREEESAEFKSFYSPRSPPSPR